MIFYDEGTAYLSFPCSHYNSNTVPVSRAAARAAVGFDVIHSTYSIYKTVVTAELLSKPTSIPNTQFFRYVRGRIDMFPYTATDW